MCDHFGICFIDFMLKTKGLLDYVNLFSTNKYETNDKIILILKYFQQLKVGEINEWKKHKARVLNVIYQRNKKLFY